MDSMSHGLVLRLRDEAVAGFRLSNMTSNVRRHDMCKHGASDMQKTSVAPSWTPSFKTYT